MNLFGTKTLVLCFLVIFPAFTLLAQNIREVDPESLSESEIQKIENTIRESGMSIDEAARVAQQRGATPQQIEAMKSRIGKSSARRDTVMQMTPETEEETENASPNLSQRKSPFKEFTENAVFGSELFNRENLTFEPSTPIQPPQNYKIGIGDQIIITIWGNSQNNYQLEVNTNGQIFIPDVGPVFIAGLPLRDARNKIKKRLSAIYEDMNSPSPQTFAQVNMGQLHSIQVNITGEATAPGTYSLPPTATLFNALYLSAGPGEIGSYRNIRIIRDNKTYRTIDIYPFLLEGNTSNNIELRQEDIIFIPPVRKEVTVTGEFKRNKRFEIQPGETLKEVIEFAGGFTPESWQQYIQIHRKTPEGTKIIDVPFDELETTGLKNGDLITTGELTRRFSNRVTISGAVHRAGEYEWKPNMSLMNLIHKADSLKDDAYLKRVVISRLQHDSTRMNLSIDLRPALEGEEVVPLRPEDIVLIKSHYNLKETPSLTVSGEVREPGTFEYAEETTLADAIFLAGGFTEGADSTFIEVARRLSYAEAAISSEKLVHIFSFDLPRSLEKGSQEAEFVLEPFDHVSVRRAPGYRENANVMATGEVVYAGMFALRNKNQRISDLLDMSGGLTPHSYPAGATFTRVSEEMGTEKIAIEMTKILQNPGGPEDLILNDGDILHIPEFMQTVKITGSVQNPFSITYEQGRSLKYYIDKSGGFSDNALKRKVFVRYPNGATASTKSFIVKSYPKVLPGSQIVVPAKPEKNRMETGQWLAIASTFSSIAVAIAAILR